MILNVKNHYLKDKLTNIFWPIKKSEMSLFIPLALMMLCMLFNFGALRSIKDSLVVPNIGAEVISFLKLWFVFPSTIIFTLLYVKLSNILSYEYLFYLIISFFLSVFIILTYVIFPNQEMYHPSHDVIHSLTNTYPNLKWFIYILGKWSYAFMYIFCELWSAVIINLLFWQYANHIFDTDAAKRFYPFLGVIGNVGLIIAGNVLVAFSDISTVSDINILHSYVHDTVYQCENVLKPIMKSIIFAGILTMVLYFYIDRYVLYNRRLYKPLESARKKTVTKLSCIESIKLLMGSKYIGHIVLLVLCYGLLINLLEGPWKASLKEVYPNTIDYLHFMGKFNIWMGVSSVIFMVIGSNILRSFSWLTSALITPIMLVVTGVSFFIFIIFSNHIYFFGDLFHPLYWAVMIGAMQNILSKSTKYSLFDSTKEMAYIPLSLELRTKGKAVVEVIGLKLGKSLGAFIQSFMFILMPLSTFDSVTVYLLGVFIVVITISIWNVYSLNIEYIRLKSE